jgi:hypothetical protein
MRWTTHLSPLIIVGIPSSAEAGPHLSAQGLPALPAPEPEASDGSKPPPRTRSSVPEAAPADTDEPEPEAPEHPGSPHRPVRDGFYLRASLGPAYMSTFGDGPAGPASQHGSGVGLSLSIGGSPMRGLVLAGTFRIVGVGGTFDGFANVGSSAGASLSGSGGLAQIGVLADWYPESRSGWHAGASLAVTGAAVSAGTQPKPVGSGSSAGGALFGGYDWWTGGKWSLGLMAVLAAGGRVSLHDSQGNDSGYSMMPVAFAIEGVVTVY